jgi:hypothetical protein
MVWNGRFIVSAPYACGAREVDRELEGIVREPRRTFGFSFLLMALRDRLRMGEKTAAGIPIIIKRCRDITEFVYLAYVLDGALDGGVVAFG